MHDFIITYCYMNGTAKSENDFILKIEEAKPQSNSMCTATNDTFTIESNDKKF